MNALFVPVALVFNIDSARLLNADLQNALFKPAKAHQYPICSGHLKVTDSSYGDVLETSFSSKRISFSCFNSGRTSLNKRKPLCLIGRQNLLNPTWVKKLRNTRCTKLHDDTFRISVQASHIHSSSVIEPTRSWVQQKCA